MPTREIALKPPQAPVDFVIITALEEEREAVLTALRDYVTLDKGDGDIHTYYCAQVQSNRRDQSRYHVIVTCLINMGPITATAQTVAVVNRWRPRYVLLVGITCGIRGEVGHGDVIVASQVADYTLGKQLKGKRQVRWSVFPCGASLLDSANNVRGDWHSLIPIDRPQSGKPLRLKGVVASGGDVIQDDRILATYSESWPKLAGIEMESAGVAAAIYQTPERPEFLMIKGVSDFGSDKHEEAVRPWREYSSHSAAAFAISVIKSGPSRSLTEIEESLTPANADALEARRTAEREWAYIQQHKIVKVNVLFLLKEPVGQSFFRSILEDSHLQFERRSMSQQGQSFKLSAITKAANAFNRPYQHHGAPRTAYAFWQLYEKAPGHWCKIISQQDQTIDTVAGFEANIPWEMFELQGIETLQDLAQLNTLGISLPISAFELGIEEFELQFLGDTFWFRISLGEDGILGPLHEMCLMQHSVSDEAEKYMPIGTGFSGVQILDRFLREFLQQHSVLPRPELKRFPMGFCGPDGEEIHFFPDVPKDFNRSPEMDKYSFTVTTQERDYAAYIEAAESATQANPSDPKNYIELARLYWAQGRRSIAIETLNLAIEKFPTHPGVHQVLGTFLSAVDRTNEATEHFRCAVLLNEKSVSAQTALGITLSNSGKHAEAIEHFLKVVDIQPNDLTAHHNLGFAFAKNGQYQEALPHFKRAADSGHLASIKMAAAFIAEFQGMREARPYFEQAVQLAPEDADAWEQLGSHFAICKEPEKAIECYTRAIAADDKNPRTHELVAATLADLGRWEEAERPMRRAFELAPENAQINRNLVAVLANLGRFDEATELLRRLIDLDPGLLGDAGGDNSMDSDTAPGTETSH